MRILFVSNLINLDNIPDIVIISTINVFMTEYYFIFLYSYHLKVVSTILSIKRTQADQNEIWQDFPYLMNHFSPPYHLCRVADRFLE